MSDLFYEDELEAHCALVKAIAAIRSWKPEMFTSKWDGNALRFATKEEADGYALNLFWRWTTPTDWRSVPSDDAPNATWVNGRLGDVP